MQRVFVVDKNRNPLMPCHPARARQLLKKKRAAVLRRYPFTIILLDRVGGRKQAIQIKFDPGSKTTGIALVADFKRGIRCVWAAVNITRWRLFEMFKTLLANQALTLNPSPDRRFAARRGTSKAFFSPSPSVSVRENGPGDEGQNALKSIDQQHLFKASGLPLEVGTGGRTKFNRRTQVYPKTHWIDAACVGESGEQIYIAPEHAPLVIKATGRQSRLMCWPDKYGFPRTKAKAGRVQKGFQTSDIVRAVVPSGKKQGTYVGRVAVRSSGSFNITTNEGTVQGISYRYCTPLHKSDGYSYQKGEAASSTR